MAKTTQIESLSYIRRNNYPVIFLFFFQALYGPKIIWLNLGKWNIISEIEMLTVIFLIATFAVFQINFTINIFVWKRFLEKGFCEGCMYYFLMFLSPSEISWQPM